MSCPPRGGPPGGIETVLLLGTPLLKNQVGTAVYQDGVWKVAISSFCGLAYLEYPKGSPQLPAACRS